MPVTWLDVASGVAQAALGVASYLQHENEAAERRKDRDMILRSIDFVREDLLDTLVELRILELKGDLEGLQIAYGTYDPDPNSGSEEDRLIQIIQDSSNVLGNLGAGMDAVSSQPKIAIETWGVYLPVLYLWSQALIEREITYGAAEIDDIPPRLDQAHHRLQQLLKYLRKESDRRFGPVTCRVVGQSGGIVCFYRFEGKNIICFQSTRPGDPRICDQSRARHMEESYAKYEAVPYVKDADRDLLRLHDALSTRNALPLLRAHGVQLDGMIFEDYRFQPPGEEGNAEEISPK